jgi:cell division protein FtsW
MAIGVLISMAASPPVAGRIGLNTFHFFKFQLAFLLPAVVLLISVSLLNPGRRAALLSDARASLPDGCRAFWGPNKGAHRWINLVPLASTLELPSQASW